MATPNDTRFWDRAARKYAATPISDPTGYERTLARTREALPASSRVLELGCGTGSTALRLAGAAAHYLATDISPAMIAIAQEKRAAAPVPNLAFEVATAHALADRETPFDAVLAFNYLHLVHDLAATLAAIHRLVRPDGVFISKTACLSEMNPALRFLALPAMQLIGKAPHVGSFTRTALRQAIEKAGFEVLAMEIHAGKGDDRRPFIIARRR